MPAFTAITLLDRQSTPVAHVFNPSAKPGDVAEFRAGTGVPIADKKMTLSLREANGRYRGKMVLAAPVVQTETINGISRPVVVRTHYAELNVTFAASSTEEERNDFIGLVESALDPAITVVDGMIVGLKGIY